jgi:23S rRNA (adenine2503-C2)-methyltransferase
MTNVSPALRASLRQEFSIEALPEPYVARSEDGTRKLLFSLEGGGAIESVLIPDPPRLTICISSQVGCAMGCAFCATARLGLQRHLTAAEIVGQILAARRQLDESERITNVVFMGMGEPLANYDALLEAIEALRADWGQGLSARRITVSTVGLVPRMLELGEKYPVVLAVSLHAADDELRGRIMPVNKRYDLAAVLDACRAFPRKSRERITFEYALLSGVNDRKEDAERLIALLGDLRCKVNLIPFNEHEGAPFTRPDDRHVTRFDRWLRDGGVPTFVRRTRGRDIAAACGQLALGERKRGAVVADQAGPTD